MLEHLNKEHPQPLHRLDQFPEWLKRKPWLSKDRRVWACQLDDGASYATKSGLIAHEKRSHPDLSAIGAFLCEHEWCDVCFRYDPKRVGQHLTNHKNRLWVQKMQAEHARNVSASRNPGQSGASNSRDEHPTIDFMLVDPPPRLTEREGSHTQVARGSGGQSTSTSAHTATGRPHPHFGPSSRQNTGEGKELVHRTPYSTNQGGGGGGHAIGMFHQQLESTRTATGGLHPHSTSAIRQDTGKGKEVVRPAQYSTNQEGGDSSHAGSTSYQRPEDTRLPTPREGPPQASLRLDTSIAQSDRARIPDASRALVREQRVPAWDTRRREAGPVHSSVEDNVPPGPNSPPGKGKPYPWMPRANQEPYVPPPMRNDSIDPSRYRDMAAESPPPRARPTTGQQGPDGSTTARQASGGVRTAISQPSTSALAGRTHPRDSPEDTGPAKRPKEAKGERVPAWHQNQGKDGKSSGGKH